MLEQSTPPSGLPALSTAVLGAALDSAGVGIVVTDPGIERPGPIIRFVNSQFEALTGYPAAELIGKSPRILQGPRTERSVLSRMREALKAEQKFAGRAVNYRKDGQPYTFDWIVDPVLDGGRLAYWVSIQRDASEEDAEVRAFSAELQHRTRNLISRVQSIAEKTLRDPTDLPIFKGRLSALSRVQTALAASGNDRLELAQLLVSEFKAANHHDSRVRFEGPAVALPRHLVELLALVVHELVSFASSGVLADDKGRVTVSWWVVPTERFNALYLRWRHRGGAPAKSDSLTSGFGRELIERALPFTLQASASLDVRPDSLACDLTVPISPVSAK